MVIRQAVFLVGGLGTRLGQITADTPKPLLELAPGLRFLDVLLEEAARQGFTDLVLLAGHQGQQVEAQYHGRVVRGATIRVVREAAPQGTGGALRGAAAWLQPWFLLANGDSWLDINLRGFVTPASGDLAARLALRRVDDPGRYGAVEVTGETVTAFREKDPTLIGPALVNGGVYLINKAAVLDLITGPCAIERDVFPMLAARGQLQGRAYEGFFLDIGLPDTYGEARRTIPPRRVRPAAFLDRDGVLNIDRGYVHRREDLVFTDQAAAGVRRLNEAGYFVFVVTNQSGVARGYYTETDVQAFHQEMADQLAASGAFVDAFYYCPYHGDGSVPAYTVPDHPDRKPNPGMLLRAMQEWPVDAAKSFMIGDQDSDLEAARRAGIKGFKMTAGTSLLDVAVRALTAGAAP